MRRPSLQFYPADWRSNANLRRCSWAARGAWIEILGLMHDSDEYGVLRYPLAEIAHSIGCPVKLVNELRDKGALKGGDKGLCEPYVYTPRHAGQDGEPVTLIEASRGPLWYSSRLVRDEYVRRHRGEGSRFKAEPKPEPKPPPKAPPKPPIGGPEGYGSSSSSSSSTTKDLPLRGASGPDSHAGKDLFSLGRELLTAQGVSSSEAGSLLGKLRRDHGDEAVRKALQFAEEKNPSELRAWLVKTVPAMASGSSKRSGVHIGHQEYGKGWGTR
jgi:hypothetical protein